MRIWSGNILPYLPDLQFKGQLRELMAIMRAWRDNGKTNHLLINKVMEYPKEDFSSYFLHYRILYKARFGKPVDKKYIEEVYKFCGFDHFKLIPYMDWLETRQHLRIEMANLYEKHLGVGKSRITDEQWQILLDGYKEITGENYKI